MKATKVILIVFFSSILLLVVAVSCSTVSTAVIGGVQKGVGKAVEERVEQAVYKKLAPKEKLPPPASPQWGQFMALQAQVVFSYTFSAGGYWVGGTGYKPGEYTKFDWIDEGGTKVILERAFLKKLDDGNEWWRVSWSDEEGNWIYEALLSPSEERMVRLRARDADGNEGEIPLTEEAIYVPPVKVSDESIKGATVGRETVETPAGKFTTDHVVFVAATGEGKVEWWITDSVPGGVVKYLARDNEQKTVWTSILREFGKNAETVLSSY